MMIPVYVYHVFKTGNMTIVKLQLKFHLPVYLHCNSLGTVQLI